MKKNNYPYLNSLECDKCTLKGEKFVGPQNTFEAEIAFVGEAPGETETLTGVPFTGSAGKMLNKALYTLGINRQHVYITNICKCRPPENRTPTLKEMLCCYKGVLEELSTLPNLKYVVCLGEVAAKALLNKDLKWRGNIVPFKLPNNKTVNALITYHPAFVLRKRTEFQTLCWDIYKLFNIPKEVEEKYKFDVDMLEGALWLKKWKQEGKVVAVDIETHGPNKGLDPYTDNIIGCAFCGEPGVAFNFIYSNNADCEKWLLTKEWLEDEEAKKVFHNMGFDVKFFKVKGVDVKGVVWDTLHAMHIQHSGVAKTLDYLRSVYTNMPPYKNVYQTSGGKIAKMTRAQLSHYNCLDVDVTQRAYLEQKKYLSPKERKLFEESLRMEDIAIQMGMFGVLVDKYTLGVHLLELGPQVQDIEDRWLREFGININSPIQLRNFLKLEKTDEDSLKDALEKEVLDSRKKLIKEILEHREKSKALNTYLVGVLKLIKEDGRIHPDWKPTGADTGRWACRNPNLQNIPEKYRDIFIAPKGYTFVIGDYSQLELFVAALLIEDYKLVDSLLKGEDIHSAVREEMCKIAPATRTQAKAIVFGTMYGRSPISISMEWKIPIYLARKWQDIVIGLHPSLKRLADKNYDTWVKKGYVESWFGRRKYCENIRQAYNHPIQSTAAEVTARCLLKLFEIPEIRPIITVHDENVIEVPEDKLEELMPKIKNAFQYATPEFFDKWKFKIWTNRRWLEV